MSLLTLLYLAPAGLRTKRKGDASSRLTDCLFGSFFLFIGS